MAVSTIYPKTALIVIDLQKGIVTYPTAHPIEQILQHAAALAKACRRHHQPVVLVNVAGAAPGRTEQVCRTGDRAADWDELVPQLNRRSSDLTVTKQTWGAFTNTGL